MNFLGVEASFRFTVVITLLSLVILVVFYIGAIPKFDFSQYATGDQGWLTEGIPGIFYALPFAIWFYLAIEELPLVAEESHDPRRDIPRGTIYIFYLVAIVYFAVAGRHRLVLSPEEEFAMTRGEHGHPEREGYGTTRVEETAPRPAGGS